MNRTIRLSCTVAAVVAIAAPGAVRADDQDTVAYRQLIMKTLGEQAQSIGMIVQGKAPAENIAVHAQVLAIAANAGIDAFTLKVQGGEARPDVWTKWDDFSKKMAEFSANASDLAKAAKAGGVEAVKAKMQSALTCKGCHDVYREQKK